MVPNAGTQVAFADGFGHGVGRTVALPSAAAADGVPHKYEELVRAAATPDISDGSTRAPLSLPSCPQLPLASFPPVPPRLLPTSIPSPPLSTCCPPPPPPPLPPALSACPPLQLLLPGSNIRCPFPYTQTLNAASQQRPPSYLRLPETPSRRTPAASTCPALQLFNSGVPYKIDLIKGLNSSVDTLGNAIVNKVLPPSSSSLT